MANVLVTGGAGFIGSHLATRLVELGHRVRILDDFSTGRRANIAHLDGRYELVEADLSGDGTCDEACHGIDYIFHQAAVPSVPKSVDDPQASHDTNINGTFNLLRAAVTHKVRRVVYAASSSTYGDSPESSKHEDIRPQPLSPYAVQKCTGEMYARAFFECYGLESISLRYFNVFGERQDPKSQYAAVIPAFVTAILAGEPPVIYGDGEQTRDFTYIANVVHGNILAMEAEKTCGQSVNIACGQAITVNEAVAAINRILGTSVQPRYEAPRAGDVRHSCADVRLARDLLGFEPRVSFDEGLSRAIEYYRGMTKGE